MNWLDVSFEFDESGRIVVVKWSDGSWDEWTYHSLNK